MVSCTLFYCLIIAGCTSIQRPLSPSMLLKSDIVPVTRHRIASLYFANTRKPGYRLRNNNHGKKSDWDRYNWRSSWRMVLLLRPLSESQNLQQHPTDMIFLAIGIILIRKLEGSSIPIGQRQLTATQLYTLLYVTALLMVLRSSLLSTLISIIGTTGLAALSHATLIDSSVKES